MPGNHTSVAKHKLIHDLSESGMSQRAIAESTGLVQSTVWKLLKRPVKLPESWAEVYEPFEIKPGDPYRALILSDVHIPFHDKKALDAAIKEGQRRKCNTVILNGDVFDQHNVSKYPHDGSKLTYVAEIEAGKQFLVHLRQKFRKAEVFFKEGNHDERLEKYLLSRAYPLFGLKKLELKNLVEADGLGIQWIGEQRVMRLGQLRMIHGHEYGRGSINAPVSAARWLMLRARKHAICGHLHQTSIQVEQNIDGKQVVTWSLGCLSGLSPKYQRLNSKWNHGFAIIDVHSNGEFEVDNLQIVDGKVV